MVDKKFEKYLTPYKYGRPVLTGSGREGAFDEQAVDIPFVFRHNHQFYMLYTGFDGKGYQSALAVSHNLLDWTHKGIILKREQGRWDGGSAAATWMIKESDEFGETARLRKIDGRYWMVYHSYPGEGYEKGPAQIGLAWCEDEELLDWHRLEKPVFSWKDGADWEKGGLYKACIIRAEKKWYLFYNAKDTNPRWIEQTGAAVSEDLLHWERCSKNPLLKVTEDAWDSRFVSDPYIVKDGELWLDFYFGLGSAHAQEGLAYSCDLLCWKKLENPIIEAGAPGEMDEVHAHKASVFYYKGTLYHFYCGVRPYREGDATKVFQEYRSITVAASKPFGKGESI